MNNCLAIIFAHDEPESLLPLVNERVAAAIPFAGKYRNIDFSLSNCLHSGIRNILVCTYQKYYSLQKHLRDGWSVFNPELSEYITVVPPQVALTTKPPVSDFDLISQQLYLLERSHTEYVMLLNGAHIYRMDYSAMLDAHIESSADMSLACTETFLTSANCHTIVTDENNRITRVSNDCQDDSLLSMGVLICNREQLIEKIKLHQEALTKTSDCLSAALVTILCPEISINAYKFGGHSGRVSPDNYWAAIDSLDTYYTANMDLLNPEPSIDIYQHDWHIRTYQQQTPPARTVPDQYGNEGIFINSILAGGSVIEGGSVQHSILFPSVYVGSEAFVENAIIFDKVRIESGAKLKNCIVEKHNSIPRNEEIGHDLDKDRKRFQVTEKGIVIIPPRFNFK